MVGPSSSHIQRGRGSIGFVAQKLLGNRLSGQGLVCTAHFWQREPTRNPESAECGTFRNGAGRHADSGQLSPGRGEGD